MHIARDRAVARAVLATRRMAMAFSAAQGSWRSVLLVIEDQALSDVLAEALVDAGHTARQVDDVAGVDEALAAQPFDAAIVDLDTRARDGAHLIARLRAERPAMTVIALLPCGGLPGGAAPPPYHLAIEKPARLAALLSAVNVAHAAIRN